MPMDAQAKKLLTRWEALKLERATTENSWQEIADNLLGRRDFISRRTPGERRMQRIYDGTSKVAGEDLAGALHSLMTNPTAPWFELRFERPELNEMPTAMRWLFATEKRIHAALTRPDANFHAQMSEVYIDLVYFGTAGLFVEDKLSQGTIFSARPLSEIYVAENSAGRIDTVFLHFEFNARQAFQEFGKKDEWAAKNVKEGKTEERAEYLHAIIPNEDYVEGTFGKRGKKWSSFKISVADVQLLEERGYAELPIAVARWNKDSNEVYGRGPGWSALSDQKMLNEMMKVVLKAGQKAVDPPLLVDHEGVLGTNLRTEPGGIIPVSITSALMNPPVAPLQYGGRFEIATALIQDARQAVRNAFRHQLIEMIRDPRMTATQVLELSAQVQRLLAPVLGRQHTELLEPIVERVFAIEARAGRLLPPPPEISGESLKVDYSSPVARAQKSSDARAIVDLFTIGANLSQVDQSVLDVLDADSGIRAIAESLGTPPTVTRTRSEVEERREAQADLLQQREAISQVGELAKAAGKVAPLVQATEGA